MANPNRVKFSPQDDYSWFAELPMLLSRHSGLGIGVDVYIMNLDELRGVHRFLIRQEKPAEVCDE